MAHYMLRWQLSTDSAKGFIAKPQNRTKPAQALIEGFGGTMLCYYFALGEYDGVAICDFPDNVAVTACSMQAASTGAFSRFETTVLLTAQEAEAAMQQAKGAKVKYVAPNG